VDWHIETPSKKLKDNHKYMMSDQSGMSRRELKAFRKMNDKKRHAEKKIALELTVPVVSISDYLRLETSRSSYELMDQSVIEGWLKDYPHSCDIRRMLLGKLMCNRDYDRIIEYGFTDESLFNLLEVYRKHSRFCGLCGEDFTENVVIEVGKLLGSTRDYGTICEDIRVKNNWYH
jgi:hypothetical protein